jgi:hypothetical protein
MKKLILLLLGSISIAIGMQKTELPVKPGSQNVLLQPTDANLSRILWSGSINDLRAMLDKHIILPTRIFLTKPFEEKSLLQATIELQLSSVTGKEGRYEIAQLLLDKKADARDLDAYLVSAVKAADEKLVTWLIAHGVQDLDGKAAEKANELENAAHVPAIKKQALARIKKNLPGRRSLLTPIMKKPSNEHSS